MILTVLVRCLTFTSVVVAVMVVSDVFTTRRRDTLTAVEVTIWDLVTVDVFGLERIVVEDTIVVVIR